MLRFRILGPVEVCRDDSRVALGGRRQVALLAFLLLQANRAVSTDQLIEAVWGEHDPSGAIKRLQVAVGRLRRLLDGDRNGGEEPVLRTVPGGYMLTVAP